MGRNGRPQLVPEYTPETEEEKKLFEEAKKRIEQRKKQKH
jgi:acyl-CoA hydrolase